MFDSAGQLIPVVVRVSTTTIRVTIKRSAPLIVKIGVQGPSGPTGPPGSKAIVIQALNQESFTLRTGQPVMLVGGGGCRLAKADNVATIAAGLVFSDASPSQTVDVLLLGLLTSSDWTSPTGGSPLLTERANYFLSQGAPGIITTIPPDGTGQVCQHMAYAVSATELFVNIDQPIIT